MAEKQDCATAVLDTLPFIMRAIGSEMHQSRPTELTMHQFRTMMIVRHRGPAPVSLLADHLGVSMSAVSKMVDGLVERGFIAREVPEHDRRCVLLTLTDRGRAALDDMHAQAIAYLAERLDPLTETDLATIEQAMRILATVFRHDCTTQTPA